MICLFTATNVSADQLRGWECWNCGKGVGEHPVAERKSIAPGQAFAVNLDTLHTWPRCGDKLE